MYAGREEVSGGSEGADQRTNRENLPAGAGEQSVEDPGQPGAARPLSGPAAGWLPSGHTVTGDHTAPCTASIPVLRINRIACSASTEELAAAVGTEQTQEMC